VSTVNIHPKKEILILMKTMNIGGAERSLLGLLGSFDYNKYNLTLMVYQHGGEFMKYIPKEVNLLPYNSKFDVFEVPIKNILFSRRFIFGLARILSKIELKIYTLLTKKKSNVWLKQQYSNKYIVPLLPKLEGSYDLAINFLGVSDLLIKRVDAKKKIGWIHTDYNQLVYNPKIDRSMYAKLDYIANVSKDCNEVFLENYPEFYDKSFVIENILSKKIILKQAEEFQVDNEIFNDNSIKILSIGRFGFAKNFDNIPEICKNIISKGIDIKWYIIGYGNDEQLIRRKIIEFNVTKNVFILGKKKNPYPYIKACDFYIQPSRFEGKSVTVREAQIISKPVIISNYKTSASQIKHEYDGFIVSQDNYLCADQVGAIIKNKKLVSQVIQNCNSSNFDNSQEIEKIERFI
jgi:glycosyltransferase involved in cell wall biosynthesis